MNSRKETEVGKIPYHWKVQTLEEYCSRVSVGYVGPTTKYFTSKEKGVPLLRSQNIRNGVLNLENLVYVTHEFHKKTSKSSLQFGDVMVVRVGQNRGDTCILDNTFDQVNCANIVFFRPLGKYAKFFELFLRSPVGQFNLKSLTTGSAQGVLNTKSVAKLQVPIPSIREIEGITETISSIEKKIDLLHRQNKTLEAMAETLFRQWFLEEAKEDWEVTMIGAQLKTVLGGTPSTKKTEYWGGDISWINSGEVNKFRILEGTKFITQKGLQSSNTKLLPIGTTVLAITGATLGQVSLLEIQTCANQSVVGVIPNDKFPKAFVFLWIKLKIQEIILNETGGAQPHINKNDINQTELLMPDESTMLNSMKVINPLFDKISTNCTQILTLENLRDTLLPKLMSGEVRVNMNEVHNNESF